MTELINVEEIAGKYASRTEYGEVIFPEAGWREFVLALSASAAPAEPVQQDTKGDVVAERLPLIEWVVERWYAEVANRPMVNVHRRSLDDTWRQMLRHLGVDDRERLGPTHDELRAEIGSKEWEAMSATLHPVQPEEAVARDATSLFLAAVEAELRRARSLFPGDRIMGLALAEEFGELIKAMLDESGANVWKEAVQTAVMAARVAIDGDSSVDDWRASKGLDNHRCGAALSRQQDAGGAK